MADDPALGRLHQMVDAARGGDAPALAALEAYVASLGEAEVSEAAQRGRLAALLEAAPVLARAGRVDAFVEAIEPLLVEPERRVLDDLFASLTDPILQAGQWGTIDAALDALRDLARRQDSIRFWVAYAKTLAGVVDAHESLGRRDTATSLLARFDEVHGEGRGPTRLYHALALATRVEARRRDDELDRAEDHLLELEAVAAAAPLDQAKGLLEPRSQARSAMARARLEAGDLEGWEEHAEALRVLLLANSDGESSARWFEGFGQALPRLVAEGLAGPWLTRAVEVARIMNRHPGAGVRAAGALQRAGEAMDAGARAACAPGLAQVLRAIEAAGRREAAVLERAAEARQALGLPPRTNAGAVSVAVVVAAAVALAAAAAAGLFP